MSGSHVSKPTSKEMREASFQSLYADEIAKCEEFNKTVSTRQVRRVQERRYGRAGKAA